MPIPRDSRIVGAAATALLAAGLIVGGTAAAQLQTDQASAAANRITTIQQLNEHIQLAVASERAAGTVYACDIRTQGQGEPRI
jgi:hypothetical protein